MFKAGSVYKVIITKRQKCEAAHEEYNRIIENKLLK